MLLFLYYHVLLSYKLSHRWEKVSYIQTLRWPKETNFGKNDLLQSAKNVCFRIIFIIVWSDVTPKLKRIDQNQYSLTIGGKCTFSKRFCIHSLKNSIQVFDLCKIDILPAFCFLVLTRCCMLSVLSHSWFICLMECNWDEPTSSINRYSYGVCATYLKRL